MMNHTIRVMGRPRRASPAARTAAASIVTAGLARLPAAWRLAASGVAISALAVTACNSGTASPTAPHAVGSSAATGTGGASSAFASAALDYARCVRAHGVPNFPDPNSHGVFPKAGIPGVSVSRIRAAERPCNHLLPAGQPALTAQDQQDYLRAAACMRSHGIINFPDPAFSGGSVTFPIPSSIDTRSEQFNQARQTCARLIPAGLPYSRSGGGS
jgi:hypothetical protein